MEPHACSPEPLLGDPALCGAKGSSREVENKHGTEGARPPVGAREALGLETGGSVRGTSVVPALLPLGAVTVTAGPFGQQENFGRHQHQILKDSSSC